MKVDKDGVERRMKIGDVDVGGVVTMLAKDYRGMVAIVTYVFEEIVIVNLEDGESFVVTGDERCIDHPRAVLLLAGRPESE